MCVCVCVCVCVNTFTPHFKGKYHCINMTLHWLWKVNKIYALILVLLSH